MQHLHNKLFSFIVYYVKKMDTIIYYCLVSHPSIYDEPLSINLSTSVSQLYTNNKLYELE